MAPRWGGWWWRQSSQIRAAPVTSHTTTLQSHLVAFDYDKIDIF
jgi:hypothetical protein